MDKITIPVEAIDEAFATLPRQLHPDQRENPAPKSRRMARAARPGLSRPIADLAAKADTASFVPHAAENGTHRAGSRDARLSAEIRDLQQQRERLAGLLSQISGSASR
jgi:hypothetical protein